jgi:quercetin dioxygenase-like cupin family protein
MSIPASEEIGSEVHPDTDQILFVLDGEGRAVVDGRVATVYSPPEYAEGTVHRSKADAMAAEALKKELAGAGAADTTAS